MVVSSNLGFVLGPAIAGVLSATALGPLLPVSAAAVISLVATLVIAFRLPDVRPCELMDYPEQTTVRKQFGQEQRDCFDIKNGTPLTFVWIRARTGLLAQLTTYFLVMLAFSFYYVSFPVFAVGDLGWSIADTGLFFAAMGLLMVAVQGPFYRWVTRQLSERVLVVKRQPHSGDEFLAVRLSCDGRDLSRVESDGT
jgi:DHA1 family tetracycline resistance protein-like MFS transporter